MNLVASLVVRNELNRYLPLVLDHLLEFCDRIVVLDDGSDDGTRHYLLERSSDRLIVAHWPDSHFYVHEGQTRNALLDATRGVHPTHVLSIDADEFVTDGVELRARIGSEPDRAAWSLTIEEVWTASAGGLAVREDGGWRTHPLTCLWKAPQSVEGWKVMNRPLAVRRVPVTVLNTPAAPSGSSLLHFGWTDPATRKARYDRYARHDGGRYHNPAHLQSILWPDSKVRLRPRPWPNGAAFDKLRERFS